MKFIQILPLLILLSSPVFESFITKQWASFYTPPRGSNWVCFETYDAENNRPIYPPVNVGPGIYLYFQDDTVIDGKHYPFILSYIGSSTTNIYERIYVHYRENHFPKSSLYCYYVVQSRTFRNNKGFLSRGNLEAYDYEQNFLTLFATINNDMYNNAVMGPGGVPADIMRNVLGMSRIGTNVIIIPGVSQVEGWLQRILRFIIPDFYWTKWIFKL